MRVALGHSRQAVCGDSDCKVCGGDGGGGGRGGGPCTAQRSPQPCASCFFTCCGLPLFAMRFDLDWLCFPLCGIRNRTQYLAFARQVLVPLSCILDLGWLLIVDEFTFCSTRNPGLAPPSEPQALPPMGLTAGWEWRYL